MKWTFNSLLPLLLLIFAVSGYTEDRNSPTPGRLEFSIENFPERVAERIDNSATDIVQWLANIDENESYAQRVLTAEEIEKVGLELELLPDELKLYFVRIVRLTFVENFSHTGIVIPLEYPGLFSVALNPRILDEDISEFFTRKENSYFRTDGSYSLRVTSDKKISGLIAIVLHELGHVINHVEQLRKNEEIDHKALSETLQKTATEPLWDSFHEMRQNPLKDYSINFYSADPPEFDYSKISRIYRDFNDSRYSSLYGTTDQGEDFAELGFLHTLRTHFKADLRIELIREDRVAYTISLTNREKVQERFSLYQKVLAELYRGDRPARPAN